MSDTSNSENRAQGYRWHAAIARDLANQCQSEGARAAMLDMARRYDRLAAFAERGGQPSVEAGCGSILAVPKRPASWHVQ